MTSNGDYTKRDVARSGQEIGGYLRHAWFETVAGPDMTPYPSEGDSPNVYYAKRVRNVSFEETVGQQEVTYADTTEFVHICNLEPEKYIEEGSLIKGWCENSRWWTIDKTSQQLVWQGGNVFLAHQNLLWGWKSKDGSPFIDTHDSGAATSQGLYTIRTGPGGAVWTVGNGGLRKYSKRGSLIWTVANGGRMLAVDTQGNAFLPTTLGIKKYDTNGSLLTTLGSVNFLEGDFCLDTDGNFFFYDKTPIGSGGLGLRKYAPDGSLIWNVTAGGGLVGTFVGQRVCVDADGNSYTAGKKFDPNGNELWSITSFRSCVVDSQGRLFVGDLDGGGGATYVRRLDPADGSQIWQAEMSASPNGFGVYDLASAGGSVYGVCPRDPASPTVPTIKRFDAETGAIQWSAIGPSAWTVAAFKGLAPLFQ